MPNSNFALDVLHSHLFLGYKPLVIAIVLETSEKDFSPVLQSEMIQLAFAYPHASQLANNGIVARLSLKKIAVRNLATHTVILYKGSHGSHRFLNRIRQMVNNLRDSIRKQSIGNVSLPGNLHDMVRIAYSVPRVISLITLWDGIQMNMFPTDLHGAVNGRFYISSLRLNGQANAQVEKLRKLCISTVSAALYRSVYLLGKNHMRALRPVECFDCASEKSATFGIPLPMGVIAYHELALCESFDVGIHRLHIYEIVNRQTVTEGSTLSHIHQYYAQWRIDHGLPTKMLLR